MSSCSVESACNVESVHFALSVLCYVAALTLFIKLVLLDMFSAACWGSPAICGVWTGLFMVVDAPVSYYVAMVVMGAVYFVALLLDATA